jgi:hypothetical protein
MPVITKDAVNRDYLRSILEYDSNTGVFTRITRTGNNTHIGDVAGGVNSNGYRSIRVGGRKHQAHRLAWIYEYGAIPDGMQIDHVNGDRQDNRICNLRIATHTDNVHNQRTEHSNNKLGVLGVSRSPGAKTYVAQIQVNGKKISLGRYPSVDTARAAYLRAKEELHPAYSTGFAQL